jgi:hypothetical protein
LSTTKNCGIEYKVKVKEEIESKLQNRQSLDPKTNFDEISPSHEFDDLKSREALTTRPTELSTLRDVSFKDSPHTTKTIEPKTEPTSIATPIITEDPDIDSPEEASTIKLG